MENINEQIRIIAEQYDIDLSKIKGSGPNGEVTLHDLEAYIKEHYFPKVKQEVKIFGIRKVIGDRLSRSYREAVHVTLNMEVEMDKIIEIREKLAKKLEKKPSYTVLMLKCIAKAIRDFIEINATMEGNKIMIYDNININIAVDSPIGLITPVIRDVDKKSLEELLSDYQDLVERAKKGILKEKDFVGGTFTVTNLGMFGIDSFTPIINPPQIAILGLNRIVKKPVIKDGEIKICNVMNLSLSFDHRAIDGAPAARFLQKVKHYLENPEEVFEVE
ncbi:dihydrolipoamide acetyltransferase family protein [Thermococcus paralvinellae]|uniref:Dihydrolipoyllysine-residue acetyltransferase component n=1 Tax=Thermococcus paralvinellae TaxID=582419 RepID=W0I0A3_9EURY|nr:dihydrolipoamide acetyltransferase family protein [Thermococcus paralvinellae]AHF79456.1 Dihydrolipoyllysine-residue acetyltransferase component [Thermococcus paralvinellae]